MKLFFKFILLTVVCYPVCYLMVQYDLWINDWIRTSADGILASGIFASRHWVTALYLKKAGLWAWVTLVCAMLQSATVLMMIAQYRDSLSKKWSYRTSIY